ncbi:nucleotidyltransferase family protein [uncultured Methanobrevibacter sp.]|uniref:nucleotidyltransferase family protein n=1 Tax=uncultured Methanobrevibacter sp. TaxID=253161 RepID=UPI00261E0D72
MPSIDFVSNIIKRDKKIFAKDFDEIKNNSNLNEFNKSDEDNEFNQDSDSVFYKSSGESDGSDLKPLVSDFTEYSPLHNGHFHCMKVAKSKIQDSLFVAIVPGLFERSGRGLPYILPREVRAEIAIAVGADIVVEGPPMGVMGSGQYSLCLAKMFQALNTDFIPRGYRPFEGYDEILNRISLGHGVAPKPYKIVDMDTREVLLNGKLEEDNYVIVSFSKSLKRIGFDFKDKFIFVPRIEGVSGTLIRQACLENNLNYIESMLPKESLEILKRELDSDRAPLHDLRDFDSIIKASNSLSLEELSSLNLFNEKLARQFVENRENKEFESIGEIEESIFYGFSSHYKNRVLSILETQVSQEQVSRYIDNYPYKIRVLDYKDEKTLEEFRQKVFSNKGSFVYKIELRSF